MFPIESLRSRMGLRRSPSLNVFGPLIVWNRIFFDRADIKANYRLVAFLVERSAKILLSWSIFIGAACQLLFITWYCTLSRKQISQVMKAFFCFLFYCIHSPCLMLLIHFVCIAKSVALPNWGATSNTLLFIARGEKKRQRGSLNFKAGLWKYILYIV